MSKLDSDVLVLLDLNNPVFQKHLFTLQEPDQQATLKTLDKIRRMTWSQVYNDNGLKWEKIVSVMLPAGIPAIYSVRITQARRATAYRDGTFMRFLTIAPDQDATYGKK